MGRRLFKQPNGLYGIYSTYSDNLICCNVTKEEYIQFRVDELKEELEDMFAKQDATPWKHTHHAEILDADIMLEEISYYSWDEKALISNLGMLRAAGYSKEQCDELEAKWNEFQKDQEVEEDD